MATIMIADFTGMKPLRAPFLLADSNAQYAENAWLYRGEIRGFRHSPSVHTLQYADTQQVYRIPASPALPPVFPNDIWLEQPDPFVKVVRNPTIGDTFKRYYFFPSDQYASKGNNPIWPTTSPGPIYAPLANIQAGGPYYTLGIPHPEVAPTVTASPIDIYLNTSAATAAGNNVLHFAATTNVLVGMTANDVTTPAAFQSGASCTAVTANTVTINFNAVGGGVLSGDQIHFNTIDETRSYVYTWVSAYGEEGPPSLPTVVRGGTLGTWNITLYAPTAADTTNRNLAKTRIYRTVTDSQGNTSYYQVDEIPITQLTYVDNKVDTQITANNQLSTVDYTGPPAGLQGVVMMANGIAAGFTNEREVWFSAAYQLHAWPAVFSISVQYPIVGLTPNGSSVNIITEGSPYIATGVSPDTMTLAMVPAFEPCIGRGSIVASGEGGYYASPNGLQVVNTNGTTNVTAPNMEKEFFNTLAPWNWAAGKYGSSYVGFFKNSLPDTENGFVVDGQDQNVPFTYINSICPTLNVYPDEISGQLFYVTNKNVYQWNPPIGTPDVTTLWSYKWKSKQFRFTFPQQFMAFLVLFDIPPEVSVVPGVRNNDQGQAYNQATQLLIVRVYADEKQIVVREVQTSGEVILIPGGSKWTLWEFQFEGQVEVKFFKVASSVKELRAT